MGQSWLQQLEEDLEKKLSEFLEANPYQELLLTKQKDKDAYLLLKNKQEQIEKEATQIRKELIEIASEVKEWSSREELARNAGHNYLANQAKNYLNQQLQQGRKAWTKLEMLGNQFRNVKREVHEISQQSKKPSKTPETDWNKFETELELESLKQKNNPNN